MAENRPVWAKTEEAFRVKMTAILNESGWDIQCSPDIKEAAYAKNASRLRKAPPGHE